MDYEDDKRVCDMDYSELKKMINSWCGRATTLTIGNLVYEKSVHEENKLLGKDYLPRLLIKQPEAEQETLAALAKKVKDDYRQKKEEHIEFHRGKKVL